MALMYQDKVVADVGGGGPGGGSEYTAGPGIVIEGGEIREKVPVDVLQQAEYDALPEERKQNGVYFLPDGSGGGETSCGEVYSTEETRVGTWIDGKPLYRLVGKTTVANPTTASTILELPAEAEVQMFYGFAKRAAQGIVYSLPNAEPNDLAHNIACYAVNNTIKVWGSGSGLGVSLKNSEFWAIAEYTKTTDTAQEASE